MYDKPKLNITTFYSENAMDLRKQINAFGEKKKIHYTQTHVVKDDKTHFKAFVFYEEER